MHRLDTIRGAAHDIRHLLSTIRLSAEMLECTGSPDIARRAQRILRAVDRSAEICGDFMEGSASRPSDHVAIRDVLEDVVAHLPPHAEIEVSIDCPPDLSAEVDATAVFRAVFNLTTNALDAVAGCSGQSIRLTAVAERGWLTLRVEDDGPGLGGLPAGQRAHGALPKSCGLGLDIANRLAGEIGGALRLERTGPAGTTFAIDVPVSREPETQGSSIFSPASDLHVQ